VDSFEPGQQLKTEHAAKGKGHFALSMTVGILLLDLHFRAMAEHAFDHGSNLGRRASLELRVDASSLVFIDDATR
jgi:hypothetical protein